MVTLGLSAAVRPIIVVYFVFIIGPGFYLKRFTKTQDDFFLAEGATAPGWRVSLFYLQTSEFSNFWAWPETLLSIGCMQRTSIALALSQP
jgi:Na+/proline symporter